MIYSKGTITKIFTDGYAHIQDNETGQSYIVNYCNLLNTSDTGAEIGLRKNSAVIFIVEDGKIVECHFELKYPIKYKRRIITMSIFVFILLLLIPTAILIEIFRRIIALFSLISLFGVLSLPLLFLIFLLFYFYKRGQFLN